MRCVSLAPAVLAQVDVLIQLPLEIQAIAFLLASIYIIQNPSHALYCFPFKTEYPQLVCGITSANNTVFLECFRVISSSMNVKYYSLFRFSADPEIF